MATRRTSGTSRTPTDSPPPVTVKPPSGSVESTNVDATSAQPPVAAAPKRASRTKKPSTVTSPPVPDLDISENARRAMIAEAAYLRAERRGFARNSATDETDDWLAAEAEVDALLKARHGAKQ